MCIHLWLCFLLLGLHEGVLLLLLVYVRAALEERDSLLVYCVGICNLDIKLE